MVVPYLARAVLATPLGAFVPSCPGVWQTLFDVSSFTVRLHRLFGVLFLNDYRDCVTVFVSSAFSRTLVHDALPRQHPAIALPHITVEVAISPSPVNFRLHIADTNRAATSRNNAAVALLDPNRRPLRSAVVATHIQPSEKLPPKSPYPMYLPSFHQSSTDDHPPTKCCCPP
uniref:Uncharacterized protein n=1 Tax=Oryza rufipogon TaxID=4529 RepID=A0A0E0PY44_ORYRU